MEHSALRVLRNGTSCSTFFKHTIIEVQFKDKTAKDIVEG